MHEHSHRINRQMAGENRSRHCSHIAVIYAAILCLLLVCAGCDGFKTSQDGLQAFNRGDFTSARNIWQRLARDHDTFALYGLGKLYETGSGVGQDFEAAAIWYEKAAIRNSPYAQGALALLYSYGLGVDVNLPRAHALSILAAEGYGRWALDLQQAALTNAQILARHMTPAQQARGAEELREWRDLIREGASVPQKGALAKRPQ